MASSFKGFKMNSSMEEIVRGWKKVKKTASPKVVSKARKQALLNIFKKGK